MQPLSDALREFAARDYGAAPQGHVGDLRRRGSSPPERRGGQAWPGQASDRPLQAEFERAFVRQERST